MPWTDEARALAQDLKKDLASLALHHDSGEVYQLPTTSRWTQLPGREQVEVFHIPHPRDLEVPYLTAFVTPPGACYSGVTMNTSRLVVILEGSLTCNHLTYTPGQALYLAPGEPNTWSSEYGALGIVRYNVPPHDIPKDLLAHHPFKP